MGNKLLRNPIPFYIFLFIAFMAYQSLKSHQTSNPIDWIMALILQLPGIVIGLSFHEYAHAQVATWLGDPTPRLQGRTTINPVAHIDPFGFLALIFIQFGWGKPVMIDPRYFRKPRRDELLVALSGVTMNFILAIAFFGLIRILYALWPEFMANSFGSIVVDLLFQIVIINLVLMVFNLLPIPPLDGFNIITQVFNLKKTRVYQQIYEKGFVILMIFILFNLTEIVLTPVISFLFNTLFQIFF